MIMVFTKDDYEAVLGNDQKVVFFAQEVNET